MPRKTSDEQFIDAVKRMESATSRVRAAVVIDPINPANWGRVVITYPADGVGVVRAVAWLPGETGADDRYLRHTGRATGYGYDKATAAMDGAMIWNRKTGEYVRLQDSGFDWAAQIRDAGYIVVNAV